MSTEQRRAYLGLRKIQCSAELRAILTKKNKAESWWKIEHKKRKDSISPETKEDVIQFYLSPGVSSEMPEKKGVMKIKSTFPESTSKSILVAKHCMTMTLQTAFHIFKQVFPQHKIGFTMFRKFRPIQVRKISETNQRTCLCQKCCNTSLKSDALKKVLAVSNAGLKAVTSNHELAEMSLCPHTTRYARRVCIKRECDACRPQLVKLLQRH